MIAPQVKIVLPCTNEGPWLRATVDGLLEMTDHPSYEILVLSNGDETTDFGFIGEPRYRGIVRLSSVPERLGVGNSINVAVTPGDADYYAFLDAHCLVEDRGWLRRAVACLDAHPEASMMQPEVQQFTYAGELRPGDRVDPSCIQGKYRAYSIRWLWPYEPPLQFASVDVFPRLPGAHEAMAGGGMAVFVRAETFHALGRYDPEVGGWYPETMDYCVRAWLLGKPMIVDPTIRILHRLKDEGYRYPMSTLDLVHGVLRTAYKYLSPRRRELAETLIRRLGHGAEVEEATRKIAGGRWMEERAAHLRKRAHDDDWLFARFGVFEDRTGARAG